MMLESQALHRMAAYCSKSEHCEYDVRKKLLAWDMTEEQCGRIVSRLIQEKFLDEHRFATAFVRDKSRFGKWGKVKIAFELRKKHISDAVIREAMAEIDEEATDTILTELLQKKNKSVKAETDYERRVRLIRFAAGKGYPMDAVVRCLNKLVKGGEDDEFMG